MAIALRVMMCDDVLEGAVSRIGTWGIFGNFPALAIQAYANALHYVKNKK